MIVNFSPDLQKYTNGMATITVEGSTFAEGLRRVFNLFPQFYVYLSEVEAGKRTLFSVDGEPILDREDVERKIAEDSVVAIESIVPCGEVPLVIAVVVLVAEISAFSAIGIALMVVSMVMSILQTLMTMFRSSPDTPNISKAEGSSSAVYTWNGIQNTTASGTPIGIVYGNHRVGGHVLNIYTVSQNLGGDLTTTSGTSATTKTMLFMQIGLCEGEIESLSEVEINKLPSNYYNAVETAPDPSYVRVGAETQDLMPGFDRAVNSVSYNYRVKNGGISNPVSQLTSTLTIPEYGYVDTNTKTVKRGLFKVVTVTSP
jgi:hypothetical protein